MDDYNSHGKWVGNATLDENCTNPKALFESIVPKSEDFISNIKYIYLDGSETTVEHVTSASSKIMSNVETDFMRYGRCFTFSPTEKMIKSGIKKITVDQLKTSIIYFHTKGMFKKELHGDITSILSLSYKHTYLDLDFTVYEMLDVGGQPCETESGFNQDDCTETKLEKKSLEKFNCTTPFGTNKDRICQDYEKGSKVMDMYKETMEKNVGICHSPCSFLSIKAIKTMDEYMTYGYVEIKFKEKIKLIEAYHLYSALSMIAEIGGFVGLFLGISVNQVSALFNVLLDKFALICNRRN